MGGGLMQLVAYGAQDIYLTGNPQITFFKVVYRRHTNFSMETIQQTINGTSTLTSSATTGTVTISRNGDLVGKIYVTSSTASIEDGDQIVNEVEIEIGGQRIDRHYMEWNQIWAELTIPNEKALAYKNMTSSLSHEFGPTLATPIAADGSVGMAQIPLNFWFCRNPGLALPLIALQYHEVKLKFTWGTSTNAGAAAACKVWCDYVYLDTDERRRFAQVSHEYLIEQLQKQSATATASTKLNFNHPVKELIWTSAALNSYGTAQLKLNGHDRFAAQEEEYFQLRQPMDYHTAVPGANYFMADRPQMVSPIDTGLLTEADTPAATAATLAVASLSVHADTTAATTGGFRRGDVLLITIGGHDSTLAGGADAVDTYIVQIKTVSGAAPNVLTFNTAIPANLHSATTDADGLSVRIIARIQDPKSRCSSLTKRINCYSFALKPEEHQPSGTCNFSRIDNAKLDTNAVLTAADNIYAVNYNVLRIMSGMGGLAYSN